MVLRMARAKSHVDSFQRLVVRRDVGHGTRALMGVASGGWREVRLDKGVGVWSCLGKGRIAHHGHVQ